MYSVFLLSNMKAEREKKILFHDLGMIFTMQGISDSVLLVWLTAKWNASHNNSVNDDVAAAN